MPAHIEGGEAGEADRLTAVLDRAFSYPYPSPPRSFVLSHDGRLLPFDPGARARRTPVLAYGSNRSPQQLRRKFPDAAPALPVERATLLDHDVVYSAHITTYGSIPAALRHMPGTAVDIAVTWLDEHQLETMHVTEVGNENYVYVRLEDVRVGLEDGAILTYAYAYLGTRRQLVRGGAPIGVAAVSARRRRVPAMDQGEVLALVRDMVAPATDLRDFILSAVADPGWRRARMAALAPRSIDARHWPRAARS